MNAWAIQYTHKAESDLETIYEYIAFELLEPDIAHKQIIQIMDAVESLDQMPFRYRLYDREPWSSRGLRILTVNKYLVFYLPHDDTSTITVVRIVYGGRDIESELIS